MVKIHCTNCSKRCVGDALKVGEKYFHQKCFQCKDCNLCLDTGGFFFRNGDYYCQKDYTKRFSNKCFICFNLIESDIVSALNNHFHRNCFKCTLCSKTFSTGDRVTMKCDQFLCNSCVSNKESESNGVKFGDFNSVANCNKNNEVSYDDVNTDQGYISADPTSTSFPTSNDDQDKRSSLSRSLFEFGKFYRSSYLELQETQQKERQFQSRQSSSRSISSKFSNNFHLPLPKNQFPIIENNDISSIRSGIDRLLSPTSSKITSVSTSDINHKENVIRQSSYPAGEKPFGNVAAPMEREDWPAPLSTAVLIREKGLRNDCGDNVVDHAQSLNHLVSNQSGRQQRSLIEVLKGSPKNAHSQKYDENVISTSRSPNASREPSSKPRFSNHKDKSRSRDPTYYGDAERHNTYSLEFINSTTRSFMAGRRPCALKSDNTRGEAQDVSRGTCLKPRTIDSNNSNKRQNEIDYQWTIKRTMSDTYDTHLKNMKYGSTIEGTLFDNNDEQCHSSTDIVTGLRITKTRYWNDKIRRPIVGSDKSSMNCKMESVEQLSILSQKLATKPKTCSRSYDALVSRQPQIMKGLDPNRLEVYLSTEEFQQLFKLNHSDFYRLPEWKRNDLKRRVKLF